MLLGVAWFYVLKARAPHTLLGIENDLEEAAAAAGSPATAVAAE
ncbi:protein of unknown function [Methylocella tundrae]|nr:protein of unknown function [Methylocella tundrae]